MGKPEWVRYQQNLQAEREGAALYRALAAAERRPEIAQLFRRLADAEDRHANGWAERLRADGAQVPAFRPGWRNRVFVWLARRFGPDLVLPSVSLMEQADRGSYAKQADARAMGLPAEERSHARLLRGLVAGQPGGVAGSTLAMLEGRHRAASGNALRAAVLGASDGLLSNLSLVMGVAGAQLSGRSILITGVAGLLAGSFSMALGEWVSVQSSRELYLRQVAIERQEIAEAPDEEAEELALIYQAKGMTDTQAREMAGQIMADADTALDTLVREELGLDPGELGGSPWEAAIASFLLFAVGAILPVVPYAVTSGRPAVIASLLISSAGLFAIGATITLLTGRHPLYSGLRQMVVGLGAALITFAIGRLIGVALVG